MDADEQDRTRKAIIDAVVGGIAHPLEADRALFGLDPFDEETAKRIQEELRIRKEFGVMPQASLPGVTPGLAPEVQADNPSMSAILEKLETLTAMVEKSSSAPPAPQPQPPPEPQAAVDAMSDQKAFDGTEMMFRAADKIRLWIDQEKDIDLTKTLPLRDQFSDVYRYLGLPSGSAIEHGRITANVLTLELAKRWPAARTPQDRQRTLDLCLAELSKPSRLERIVSMQHSEAGSGGH